MANVQFPPSQDIENRHQKGQHMPNFESFSSILINDTKQHHAPGSHITNPEGLWHIHLRDMQGLVIDIYFLEIIWSPACYRINEGQNHTCKFHNVPYKKQDRQSMCNITLWHVYVMFIPLSYSTILIPVQSQRVL
jgi:hypothetical protein